MSSLSTDDKEEKKTKGSGRFVFSTVKNEELIGRAKGLEHVPWCEAYERMISGMRYQIGGVPELERHVIRVARLRQQYNNFDIPDDATFASLMVQQHKKLLAILGHVGRNSFIHAPFNALLGCNIWIGEGVVVNANFRVDDSGLVIIKDRTLIGPSCHISTGSHSLNYLERRDGGAYGSRPVEIGEDCWLGVGVSILAGVTIGKGCVVAAGAVVARDVAPFTLVGGVPARLIRYLGDPEEPGNQPNGVVSDGISLDMGAKSLNQGQGSGGDKHLSENAGLEPAIAKESATEIT